jgi:hypothetical protein
MYQMWNTNLAPPPPPSIATTRGTLASFASSKESEEDSNSSNIVIFRRSYDPVAKEWKLSNNFVPADAKGSCTVYQVFVLMWVLILYLSMVAIVLIFLVGFRGRGNAILGWDKTSSSMHNHTAAMLISMYAALGWTMSNGIVFNPART